MTVVKYTELAQSYQAHARCSGVTRPTRAMRRAITARHHSWSVLVSVKADLPENPDVAAEGLQAEVARAPTVERTAEIALAAAVQRHRQIALEAAAEAVERQVAAGAGRQAQPHVAAEGVDVDIAAVAKILRLDRDVGAEAVDVLAAVDADHRDRRAERLDVEPR